jgi:excisionase family DNA binding protein
VNVVPVLDAPAVATSTPTSPRRLLTTHELGQLLGLNPRHVYRLLDRIPHLRLGDGKGSAIRFDPDDVQAWLASRKRAAVAEADPA